MKPATHNVGRTGLASESNFVPAARPQTPTPAVTRCDDVSRSETTTTMQRWIYDFWCPGQDFQTVPPPHE